MGKGNSDLSQREGHGGVIAEVRVSVRKPPMYKVILFNDDFTPMEFVVEILQSIFHKSYEDANEIMLRVHNEGHAICGCFTCEIAEMKVVTVSKLAREKEYPLRCSMEPE